MPQQAASYAILSHLALLLCVALAGCSAAVPLELPRQAHLAPDVGSLRHEGVLITGPLTVTEVATLVVQNNPELVAIRAQQGVARAQVLQAGLLPNPQLTSAYLPLVAGVGTTSAWNAGVGEDIRSLITLRSARRAALASADQVDAQILWQEWQDIGQARLLSVDIIEAGHSLALLRQTSALLASRYRNSQRAMNAGNETLTSSTTDLAAWRAITTQIHDQERQQLARRHQLNALLGLAPDVMVALTPKPDIPVLDPRAILEQLPALADHRPDLIALQLGYQAQNAKLRTAILSRFPNLSIGITGGSDNSNVRNMGPQITLELPIFNQNQGNIAIETATRQQLHDEYSARLTAAVGQVQALVAEIDLLTRQLAGVKRELADARQVAETADVAFKNGNIDERSYVDLVNTRLVKEQEIVTIEQSLFDQRVAIATLIGAGMPAIILPQREVT
jgi:outer membrane protein TolC